MYQTVQPTAVDLMQNKKVKKKNNKNKNENDRNSGKWQKLKMLREGSKHCNRSVPHKLKHFRRSDQLQKRLSPNTNMSRFSLNAQHLSSDSSVSWKLGAKFKDVRIYGSTCHHGVRPCFSLRHAEFSPCSMAPNKGTRRDQVAC